MRAPSLMSLLDCKSIVPQHLCNPSNSSGRDAIEKPSYNHPLRHRYPCPHYTFLFVCMRMLVCSACIRLHLTSIVFNLPWRRFPLVFCALGTMAAGQTFTTGLIYEGCSRVVCLLLMRVPGQGGIFNISPVPS